MTTVCLLYHPPPRCRHGHCYDAMHHRAKIFAFATHGLFNGPAPDRIEKSALDEVVITNTVRPTLPCLVPCAVCLVPCARVCVVDTLLLMSHVCTYLGTLSIGPAEGRHPREDEQDQAALNWQAAGREHPVHPHGAHLPCPAMPCPALPCPALPCLAVSCPVLSCPVLSCPVLSCPVLFASHPILSSHMAIRKRTTTHDGRGKAYRRSSNPRIYLPQHRSTKA
jgi:hypothetical protein